MSGMSAKQLLFPILLGGILSASTVSHAKVVQPQQAPPENLCFIENKGQVTDQFGNPRKDINFRVGSKGLGIFVGNGQLHYQWAVSTPNQRSAEDKQKTAMYRMDVALLGAYPQAALVTEKRQDFHERFYLNGQQGTTANAYQKITYKEVYPNIDWVLYIKDNTVEYDFVVRPGGNVADIKLQYSGATKLAVDEAGRLTATTPMGSVTENTPQSFQTDGKKIASRFVLQGNVLSFATAPHSGTLVIDPTLSWATYYGGSGDDNVKNACISGDQYGNVYMDGYSNSTANIATTGSYKDTVTGGTDAYLVKFNGAGVRQWATYYGGTSSETVYGVSCDPKGNIYLSGFTNSTTGISTTGSHQPTIGGGSDAFLVKFDSAGVRQWGTYYGGTATEQAFAVTCDKSGNVFLCGYTNNSAINISTTGSHQLTGGGGQDGFLVKFNGSGVRQWGTYYGGTGSDRILAVTCDTNKNVYISGYSGSAASIATTGSYQATIGGGQDAFLTKFDSSGVRQWGTYYGGTGTEVGNGIGCDPNGNVYCTGTTTSTSAIASSGSFQDTYGGGVGGDGFLAKFYPTGVRHWASYYGGTGSDGATGIYCTSLGHVYISGNTSSTNNISVAGTFQDTLNALSDAMLVKFDTTGARLWGTYYGGDGTDIGLAVYCNSLSKVFLAGTTDSYTGISTSGSHQASFGGSAYDAFLAKFDDCLLTTPTSIIGNDTVCRGTVHAYSVPAVTGALSYNWTLPSGWTGTSTANTISVTVGTSSDTIKVSAQFMCGASPVIKKAVTVSPIPVISPSGLISICSGDSVTLTASTGASFTWLQDGLPISGANAQNYVAHTAHRYTVVVTNGIGCTDTSLIDTLIVHPTPVPVISVSGTILSTGTYTIYQWNHNGTAITGAVAGSYTVTVKSGNYTVTVTDSNGCKGTSAPFDANTLGIDDATGKIKQVNIYPNPVTDHLLIASAEKVNVTISSMEGRLIGYYENANRIDVSSLATGVYMLRITDKQGAFIGTEKIVKYTNR